MREKCVSLYVFFVKKDRNLNCVPENGRFVLAKFYLVGLEIDSHTELRTTKLLVHQTISKAIPHQ